LLKAAFDKKGPNWVDIDDLLCGKLSHPRNNCQIKDRMRLLLAKAAK
jgi:hypothetical protein